MHLGEFYYALRGVLLEDQQSKFSSMKQVAPQPQVTYCAGMAKKTFAEEIANVVTSVLNEVMIDAQAKIEKAVSMAVLKQFGLPSGEELVEEHIAELIEAPKKRRGRPKKKEKEEEGAPSGNMVLSQLALKHFLMLQDKLG